MKKVVSILLVVALMLSFSTIAFAREVTTGAYLGPKENIKANPGETVSFTIEFKSALAEDYLNDQGIDRNGTLVVPFSAQVADISLTPLVGFELTDAAKKAGATFEQTSNEDIGLTSDEDAVTWLFGKFSIPAEYLFSGEALDLIEITVAVSENWEVVDYKATFEPYINCAIGSEADWLEGLSPTIYGTDGSEVQIFDIVTDAGSISAKPYQPSFFERVWEWIKGKICAVIVLFQTVNTLLLNEVFAPADWYQDYINNK